MKLLFIPVSAPRGIGEYARAAAIGAAVKSRWPQAEIRFVISKEAPYSHKVPFPVLVLPSSPTFHTREVIRLISEYKPDLAVFDNAGRTAQLRAARAAGARVVFVSSRARQRRRAFRMHWMRLIDEHWIAMPELMAGPLSMIERWKLRLIERPRLRYLGALLPHAEEEPVATLARYQLQPEQYVIAVPGGGTGHPRMREGPQIITRVIERLASRGHRALLVGVGSDANSLPPLPMPELMTLIRHAKVVIVNGGDTLLQVLACKRPCVAVAMVPDQVARLRRLERAGLSVGCPLAADAIEQRTVQLMEDPAARDALVARAAALSITNAMENVLEAIGSLVQR